MVFKSYHVFFYTVGVCWCSVDNDITHEVVLYIHKKAK